MKFLSPATRMRFAAFRRNRRAWWSFLLLLGVFVFCLAADWVCPCDPRTVTDPKTLEKYRTSVVQRTYDIQTIRFSRLTDGTIIDYEGPERERAHLSDARLKERYHISRVKHPGYERFFLEPKDPPTVTEKILPPAEVSFPFRPVPEHPFGLDAGGRDVYARVVHGMRLALLFGLLLTFFGLFFGLVIGAIEGYFGGVTDIVLQRFTEIWSTMPFLYVMIFIGSTVGRSFTVLLVCYAIFNWISVSSYMRAEFLRLRHRAFVDEEAGSMRIGS